MPAPQEQLLAAGAVIGVVVLLMVYNLVRPARPKAAAASAEAQTVRGPESMVAKFVVHEGAVVGEVVALDGDRLVLKHGGRFRVVPASQAREEGGEVRLTGDIDWARADLEGSLWHDRNRKDPEAAVTGGTMTTSADVKHPALDALHREKGPPTEAQDRPPGGGA